METAGPPGPDAEEEESSPHHVESMDYTDVYQTLIHLQQLAIAQKPGFSQPHWTLDLTFRRAATEGESQLTPAMYPWSFGDPLVNKPEPKYILFFCMFLTMSMHQDMYFINPCNCIYNTIHITILLLHQPVKADFTSHLSKLTDMYLCYYVADQLMEIRKYSLAKMICNNFPVATIQPRVFQLHTVQG